MRTGRPTADPAAKALAGTYRKDRHANIVELVPAEQSVPTQPAYMTKEARMVWDEEFRRVVACGATDADSSLFATYCQLESACRLAWMKGEVPLVGQLTQLRALCELFGIAGKRSRLLKTGGNAPAETTTKSAFTVRQK